MTVAPSFEAIPVINKSRCTVIIGKSDLGMKKCTFC